MYLYREQLQVCSYSPRVVLLTEEKRCNCLANYTCTGPTSHLSCSLIFTEGSDNLFSIIMIKLLSYLAL